MGVTIEGTPRWLICRTEDPSRGLALGTQVVITRRAGGYAFVEPLDALEGAYP